MLKNSIFRGVALCVFFVFRTSFFGQKVSCLLQFSWFCDKKKSPKKSQKQALLKKALFLGPQKGPKKGVFERPFSRFLRCFWAGAAFFMPFSSLKKRFFLKNTTVFLGPFGPPWNGRKCFLSDPYPGICVQKNVFFFARILHERGQKAAKKSKNIDIWTSCAF